jgi:hypothetical protein
MGDGSYHHVCDKAEQTAGGLGKERCGFLAGEIREAKAHDVKVCLQLSSLVSLSSAPFNRILLHVVFSFPKYLYFWFKMVRSMVFTLQPF